jgi:nucleoside-diphosphate-sugar epimerase
MHVFFTGGTGQVGSYLIAERIAAGHEVVALARSDASAAAASALGARVQRGNRADLDGLKAAARASEGVIHLGYRRELLSSGGITALGESELLIVQALGELSA